MAPSLKNVPEILQDLKDLLISYAKQETVDPLRNLGRFLGFGLAGIAMLTLGTFLIGMALLRFVQTMTGDWVNDPWSWVPYLAPITFWALVIGIAVQPHRQGRHRRRRARRHGADQRQGDHPMSTNGPITRDDIEARFRAIQGDAEAVEEEARDYVALAVAAVAVVIVVGAFLVGRRRGKSQRPWSRSAASDGSPRPAAQQRPQQGRLRQQPLLARRRRPGVAGAGLQLGPSASGHHDVPAGDRTGGDPDDHRDRPGPVEARPPPLA